MSIYFDQFFALDPGNPPPAGTVLTKSFLGLDDRNNNGTITPTQPGPDDSLDGTSITNIWPGDTITVVMNGSTVTITGTTFYLSDGRRFFTPTDGTNLDTATFVSSTYVTSGGAFPVSQLGPPCFVAGTRILTAMGEVAVESLSAGNEVMTLDSGLQPISWMGMRKVPALGEMAPIRFAEGAIGNVRELWLSPQHGVLLQGWRAEMLFGQQEVLVAAKHLVNGDTICRVPGGQVSYYHIAFSQHEIVWSDGAMTESFFPGATILHDNPDIRAELLALFPELENPVNSNFAETARPVLTRNEAMALTAGA